MPMKKKKTRVNKVIVSIVFDKMPAQWHVTMDGQAKLLGIGKQQEFPVAAAEEREVTLADTQRLVKAGERRMTRRITAARNYARCVGFNPTTPELDYVAARRVADKVIVDKLFIKSYA